MMSPDLMVFLGPVFQLLYPMLSILRLSAVWSVRFWIWASEGKLLMQRTERPELQTSVTCVLSPDILVGVSSVPRSRSRSRSAKRSGTAYPSRTLEVELTRNDTNLWLPCFGLNCHACIVHYSTYHMR